MDSILEMMRGWTHSGQGAFLMFLVLVACGILGGIGTFFTVLVRGYPPAAQTPDEDEDE